jgi:Prion-inhibition and propagation
MDPQTSLAVAQLAPVVLTGCLQGYKLFTKAKTLGKDSQALLWKFRIQETRLCMWGKEWGFIAGIPTSTATLARAQANEEQVLETLLRISDLLKDYKELKRRYGLSLVMDHQTYRPAVSVVRKTPADAW